jgi:hypothetical protein
MASNDVEVLDPAVAVEKFKEIESGVALNRRHFMSALGVAGVAAGTALVSGGAAVAQQPKPNGYAQLDVMNFLMNIKYLKATLYSFITQGVDIPAATYVTLGTGQIYDQPAKITFPTQQIGDMFNEMYYDELNQLIDLRALIGTNVVANRPTMDMLGTGNKATATTTMTANQAMGMARMLEDVSVQAFAGAAAYLTGANLAYVSQILAVDGAHAGAVRLACIQNNVPYISTNVLTTTAAGAQTVNTFTGGTTTGNPTILALAPTNAPVVGNGISGVGVPEGAVVTGYVAAANSTFTAITTKNSSSLTAVSSISGLAINQPITGTNIPALATITGISAGVVTISTPATASTVVTPTGFVTSGSAVITSVSSVTGTIIGQAITGTNVPAGATIIATNSTAGTITMSVPATSTNVVTPTGIVTSGSAVVTSVSSLTGVTVGQPITGANIPAGTTVAGTSSSPNTITLSNAATGTSATAETLTTPTAVTLTTPTTETITVGRSTVTTSMNATATGGNIFNVLVGDLMDVEPYDPGTAALAAAGPSPISIPSSVYSTGGPTTPTIYQGFFNTAGAGTASANTPAGMAFARSFGQVLSVLFGTTQINPPTYQGGFFPVGVSGSINVNTDQ